MINYLTKDYIIKMNIYLIKKLSPEEAIGVKENGALEMTVNQLTQEVFGI